MPVFTSSIEVTADYPTIKPSLNLNFARARALDPRITFTRASTATYVGSDGLIKTAGENEARFDHDPDTLESLGLLIEESRTNRVTYSENFNTSWNLAAIGSVTANSITSPDGNNNGTLLVNTSPSPITVNGQTTYYGGQIYTALYGPATGIHTWSLFAKAKECEIIAPIANTNGGSKQAFFDLSNGTVFFAPADTTCTIEPYPNGWYKCSITWDQGSSVSYTYNIQVFSKTQITGSDGIYIWGAQMEAGSFPTSYIPTSGSALARIQDEGNITGGAFSSFFNTTEGVIQTEFSRIGSVNNQMVVQFKDSDGSERIEIRGQAGSGDSFRMEVIEGGGTSSQEYAFSSGAVVANVVGQFAKVNLAYKQNDFASTINGTIASTDNSGDVGVCDRVGIGYATYGIRYNGHIKNIIYYPKRLTNAQLQLLTS